jgi:heme/copper-type cytochrome/quinol oxidase subunit 2
MAKLSRRWGLAVILASVWVVLTLVCGGFYVYYPWKYLAKPNLDEYVRYPDFRTAQFLVLWLVPTCVYGVISIVAIIRVRKHSD